MGEATKSFTVKKDIKEFYKSIFNWCGLSEINVSNSDITEDSFLISGKKTYPSQVKFSWAAALGCLFLGFIMVLAGHEVEEQSSQGLFWFPLFIYVIIYFIKKRNRVIELQIKGIKESDSVNVMVKTNENHDQLNADLTQFFSKHI